MAESIDNMVEKLTTNIIMHMNNDINDAIVQVVSDYNPMNAAYEVNAQKIREAIERQTIPKKPVLEADGTADGEFVYEVWYCPVCDAKYDDCYKFAHCPNCGQLLNWFEEV